MSALGILGTSSESFLSMLTDLNFDEKTKKHALLTSMNIAIRCTYYIFFVEGTKVGQTPSCLTLDHVPLIFRKVSCFIFVLFMVNLCHCKP